MNKFQKLKQVLSLNSDPIGVKLIYDLTENQPRDSEFRKIGNLNGYCEYVKRASQGEFLKIKKGDFFCHTGNVTLGFEESNSLELTMKLESKGLKYIYLFPINKYVLKDYESIILIMNPNKCMTLIQAYVQLYRRPLKITCGAINGVCSEVTAHVIKRNEINFSFLCPSARKNRIFSDCDLLCGIPAGMTNELIDKIVELKTYHG